MHAILLYYHYHPTDAAVESAWHRICCQQLGLNGRLRVSQQGLNGTLSGLREKLLQYIEEYKRRVPAGVHVDWKLSSARADQCFSELIVRVVAEVVTLGVSPAEAPLQLAAPHLSPEEFHQLLTMAAARATSPDWTAEPMVTVAEPAERKLASRGEVVLLDTRNVYEWQIGRFELSGVKTLLPPIRQFADLPRWLDTQLPLLEGCTVLMYCTGGAPQL